MGTMAKIDHEFTDNIVCPFCGHSWEWDLEGGDEFEEECGKCRKELRVTLDHSVSFTTSKFDRAAEEAERQKRNDEHRVRVDADKLACAKFPPGTRVQVTQKKYTSQYRGRLGTVANKELSTFVYVDLDARLVDGRRLRAHRQSFPPEELEAI